MVPPAVDCTADYGNHNGAVHSDHKQGIAQQDADDNASLQLRQRLIEPVQPGLSLPASLATHSLSMAREKATKRESICCW
jgi:hypothetical protein